MAITFGDLKQLPRYSFGSYRGKTVVAHEDDRWILPVVAAARCEGILNGPVTLISLDRHHDACNLRHGLGRLGDIRSSGYPADMLLSAIETGLSNEDDDWIRAGMELGLFGDAAVWGVDPDGPSPPDDGVFRDHRGDSHSIFVEPGLPGEQLGFQGSLSDLACRDRLQAYWDAIGWDAGRRPPAFRPEMRCILNIDLDCFAIPFRDFLLPWSQEIWRSVFNKESTYSVTAGQSTASVLSQLLERVTLIAIAREPKYTGGWQNGALIEASLRRHLFKGELDLPHYVREAPTS